MLFTRKLVLSLFQAFVSGRKNQILVEMQTSSFDDKNTSIIHFSFLPSVARYERLCLYDDVCHEGVKPVYPQPFFQANHDNIYLTKVKYTCPPGKGFEDSSGLTSPSRELECSQFGNWSQTLGSCICTRL